MLNFFAFIMHHTQLEQMQLNCKPRKSCHPERSPLRSKGGVEGPALCRIAGVPRSIACGEMPPIPCVPPSIVRPTENLLPSSRPNAPRLLQPAQSIAQFCFPSQTTSSAGTIHLPAPRIIPRDATPAPAPALPPVALRPAAQYRHRLRAPRPRLLLLLGPTPAVSAQGDPLQWRIQSPAPSARQSLHSVRRNGRRQAAHSARPIRRE